MGNLRNSYIERMTNGEPIVRIGAIWYGAESGTVVTSIYYFGNKNIQSLLPLRAESAISFSTMSPPVDTLQIELIVNYSRFRTHLQMLMAQIQVSPCLPVQNPVVAAMVQPVQTNKEVYIAYGFGTMVTAKDVLDSTGREKLMGMYSRTPVHMRIDNVSIETIKGAPRDVRVVIRVTRVLTTNIYGDRVRYLRTMDDVINQQVYTNKMMTEGGDNAQIDTLSTMLGINAPAIRDMIDEMSRPLSSGEDIGNVVDAGIDEIVAPDIYKATTDDGTTILVMPYGMECFNSTGKLNMFGLSEEEERAGLHGLEGASLARTTEEVKKILGVYDSTASGPPRVTLTIADKGPIYLLDGDKKTESPILIHYCLITVHSTGTDLGNTLIGKGHAFPYTTPPQYDPAKLPPGYGTARIEAMEEQNRNVLSQLRGKSEATYILPATMVRRNLVLSPSNMRRQLKGIKTGVVLEVVKSPPLYDAKALTITSGDKITIKNSEGVEKTIKLSGLEAPLMEQVGGKESKEYLKSRIPAGRTISIQETMYLPTGETQDEDGNTLAVVTTGNNEILNESMLKEGHASYLYSYGIAGYVDKWKELEADAKTKKKGMWAQPHALTATQYRNLKKR